MPAYDQRKHRQAVRRGAERGCWVFIPASELAATGVDPTEPAPAYRLWARRNGSILLRLYGSRPAH